MNTQTQSDLAENYHNIIHQIASAQKKSNFSNEVTLIAVSKRQPIEAIEELYQLGHRDFGENYVQELCNKAIILNQRGFTGIRWHFIGHLQTNKVKAVLPYIKSIHTLDSERLALEVVKRWATIGKGQKLPVFLEINIDCEPTKSGVLPEHALTFSKTFNQFEELDLQGLMCIPKAESDSFSSFARLRELEKACRPYTAGKLSMGMSDDFSIAIQEGATHIRVGTALFGTRL